MFGRTEPFAVDVKAGETTYICRCGLSGNAPFCDGSHEQTEDKQPLAFTPKEDATVYVCGCGNSDNSPWCDGTHQQLAKSA